MGDVAIEAGTDHDAEQLLTGRPKSIERVFPRAILPASSAGSVVKPNCRANRFSLPKGSTANGTLNR